VSGVHRPLCSDRRHFSWGSICSQAFRGAPRRAYRRLLVVEHAMLDGDAGERPEERRGRSL